MLHISCNIGTCDLPDMYALRPAALALGIHIRQITRAYVTTITYVCVGSIDLPICLAITGAVINCLKLAIK